MNIPVIETEGYQGSSEVRLDARFLKDHKVFLLGEITPDSAVELTQKLIYLENEPGKKGHRHILPHSRTMIHEPLIANGIGGSATSIRHLSESIMDTKQLVNKILAFHVGKTPEEIRSLISSSAVHLSALLPCSRASILNAVIKELCADVRSSSVSAFSGGVINAQSERNRTYRTAFFSMFSRRSESSLGVCSLICFRISSAS